MLFNHLDGWKHVFEKINVRRRMRSQQDLSRRLSVWGIGESYELIEKPTEPTRVQPRFRFLDADDVWLVGCIYIAEHAQGKHRTVAGGLRFPQEW